MRRRSHLACVAVLAAVSLLLASGAHWVLLQGVAWTQMLVDYSRTESVTSAVAKTFDGKHPCRLCDRVVKESNSERKVPATFDPAQKVGFFLAPRAVAANPPPRARHKYPPSFFLMPGDVFIDPPGPVPRSRVS